MPAMTARVVLRGLGLLDYARSGRATLDRLSWLPRNLRYTWSTAVDLDPIPPTSLIRLATGTPSIAWYAEGGRLAAESIREALGRQGAVIANGRRLLDLGCGCGRVIRRWADTGARLSGTDYNARLVEWYRRNLPFATFETNDLTPPLGYDDDTFDVIYALSVLTHLPETLQLQWMDELDRVLRPSGFLIVTTHGEQYLPELDDDERQQFESGRLVVRHPGEVGSNRCGAYAPEQFVRTTLTRGLTVAEFVPNGATGNPYQDLVVFQKP